MNQSFSELLMKALGSDGQALDDIKMSIRSIYIKKNESTIAHLSKSMPVISGYGVYKANPVMQLETAIAKLVVNVVNPTIIAEIAAIVVRNGLKYWYWAPTALDHDVIDSINLISERFNQTVKEVFGQFGLMDTFNLLITGIPMMVWFLLRVQY